MRKHKPASLDQALRYQNPLVIAKFRETFPVSVTEAEDIFEQVKRFLWLDAMCGPLVMTADMRIIDEMWHTFVLFTRDYASYCTEVYGQYRHHNPAVRTGAKASLRSADGPLDQLRLIRTHLGYPTVIKWYCEYPLKYDRRFFERAAASWLPQSLSPDYRAKIRRLGKQLARTA